jgi:dihydrofolate reductase
MKTIYCTATSLDGFLATEDDSLEWLFPLGNASDSGYPEFIASVGALAMGASTYEWVLRHSARMVEETGAAWPYTQPSWVFTHRNLPLPASGAAIRFVQGDVRPVHAGMREAAANRNLWVVGGGDLAGQFFDAGLLDEAVIQVAPATLGRGKPLFPRRVTSPPWRLLSVSRIGTSFAELRYELPRNPE